MRKIPAARRQRRRIAWATSSRFRADPPSLLRDRSARLLSGTAVSPPVRVGTEPESTILPSVSHEQAGAPAARPAVLRVLWLIKGLGPGGAERLLVLTARH